MFRIQYYARKTVTLLRKKDVQFQCYAQNFNADLSSGFLKIPKLFLLYSFPAIEETLPAIRSLGHDSTSREGRERGMGRDWRESEVEGMWRREGVMRGMGGRMTG